MNAGSLPDESGMTFTREVLASSVSPIGAF